MMGTARGACRAATASLAEKPSLTNRIGRHFARIKAASGARWTIMVTGSNRRRRAAPEPGSDSSSRDRIHEPEPTLKNLETDIASARTYDQRCRSSDRLQDTSGPKAGATMPPTIPPTTSVATRGRRTVSPSTTRHAVRSASSAVSTAWFSLWPPRTER
jgi:hypothetical protein